MKFYGNSEREECHITAKNPNLTLACTVPGLTLQVYISQFAMYARTDSTRSKTCVFTNVSWNHRWWSSLEFIRSFVHCSQLQWH